MNNPFENVDKRLEKIETTLTELKEIVEDKHNIKLLTVDELVELTGLAKQTIYQKVNNGTLPNYVKVGRLLRFPKEKIIEWMHNNAPTKGTQSNLEQK
ncbi:MAG: helix-turn-helix domain-containing protein [Bacteroidales bacterium]|nr:helix-turn-helix domain-containing protein [Bacteroidales bacterium]